MHTKGKITAAIRYVLSDWGFTCKFVIRTTLFVPTSTRYSTICVNEAEGMALECIDRSEDLIESCRERTIQSEVEDVDQVAMSQTSPLEVFRRWGCNDDELSNLLLSRPTLQRADATHLETKLNLLGQLGITSSDLVKIVNCRPRILSCGISNHCLDERINFFTNFFGSKEVLRKAITRNPSLLTYDIHVKIKPVIEFFKGMGLSQEDLNLMLLSHPTLIPRTKFNSEKMEYIHKTGVTSKSKMFKYIVSLIGVSRLETIQEKIANLEKFGLSEKEVWLMIGRSPLILTLSVEKVQRNMTYIIASMKLPAHSVLHSPFLLSFNLESHIMPRVRLSSRIDEMGLKPQIKTQDILRVLRMSEKRFLRVYVMCHQEEVVAELMEFYNKAKGMKRLAEEYKKTVYKGFPF